MQESSSPNRTLDLASALEVGSAVSKGFGEYNDGSGSTRSVMTIAFEFACESHMQDTVASMARQYVRSVISSVQRVALALSPSHLNVYGSLLPSLGTPEAQTLARWVCHSYRFVTFLVQIKLMLLITFLVQIKLDALKMSYLSFVVYMKLSDIYSQLYSSWNIYEYFITIVPRFLP